MYNVWFLLLGCFFFVFFFVLLTVGRKKIRSDAANATTPPSFDGTVRKMAYANRKYHSGWM